MPMPTLENIVVWLQRDRPNLWKSVCVVSCVVGLLCFALGFTFHDLFGQWIWWKVELFIILSVIIIILLVLLMEKGCDSTIPHWIKVHTCFCVLLVTSIYSYFVEKKENAKPDVFSLVSSVAFAIMFLGLSTLTDFGFEVELFYFFTTFLTSQLMKRNGWLVFLGGAFMYSLIMLRFILVPEDERLRSGSPAPQNPTVILIPQGGGFQVPTTSSGDEDEGLESGSPASQNSEMFYYSDGTTLSGSQEDDVPPENEDEVPLQNEQDNSNNGEIITRFMDCIKAAETKKASVINTIIDKANANVVDERQFPEKQWHPDHNLVVDSYTLEIIHNLHQSAKQMVGAGFENKCLEEYISWRRMFLDEILLLLPSPNLKMEDIDDKEKIQGWLQTLAVAVRILFPNEKRLCERVFKSDYSSDFAFTEVFKELANHLLSTSYALATWSHFTPTALEELMRDFEFKFLFTLNKTSHGNEASQIRKILGYFEHLNSLIRSDAAQATIAGGIHDITREVMDYIRDVFINKDSSNSLGRCFEEYSMATKPSVHLANVIELLESSLEDTSRNCKTPSLGYVFIMNNRKFIAQEAQLLGLEHVIGHDWLRENQNEIEKNLQLYLTSSWDEILNILKLDINESDTITVVTGLAQDKLNSINQYLEDICKVQSTWTVSDDTLRKQIIKSIADILLPPCGELIDLLSTLGRYTNINHTRFRISDVEDALNKLFVGEPHEVDAPREGKKNA